MIFDVVAPSVKFSLMFANASSIIGMVCDMQEPSSKRARRPLSKVSLFGNRFKASPLKQAKRSLKVKGYTVPTDPVDHSPGILS